MTAAFSVVSVPLSAALKAEGARLITLSVTFKLETPSPLYAAATLPFPLAIKYTGDWVISASFVFTATVKRIQLSSRRNIPKLVLLLFVFMLPAFEPLVRLLKLTRLRVLPSAFVMPIWNTGSVLSVVGIGAIILPVITSQPVSSLSGLGRIFLKVMPLQPHSGGVIRPTRFFCSSGISRVSVGSTTALASTLCSSGL